MNPRDWIFLGVYLLALLLLVKPLGRYMADVYSGRRTILHPVLEPLELLIYRLAGVEPSAETGWRSYGLALLLFNGIGALFCSGILMLQRFLPFNPTGLPSVEPLLAFNITASFVSNTNWQSYSGELTLSYFSQMAALTVQNFLSAACGMTVLVALCRGFSRTGTRLIGNFWADLVRSVLYILLPLCLLLTPVLISQGVVQTLEGPASFSPLEKPDAASRPANSAPALIARGPAASQIAIKQIGTNGGGFFNANSAYPFENPTPLTNYLEMLAILLIPAALCYTFGVLVGDPRQGWTILGTMTAILLICLIFTGYLEYQSHPQLAKLGLDPSASNLEGKEIRYGAGLSGFWAVVTTAASSGSVNAMHDSFTPLGGMIPLWLMQTGEVIFGGAGSGLAGMLVFVLVAVFAAGLMVGRTPEYLGKKIQAGDIKLVVLIILIPIFLSLVGTALALLLPAGVSSISNPGPHGFTQVLYAFSSAANNNGSAFGGLNANTPFYNLVLGLIMLVGRFAPMWLTLALAGQFALKKTAAASAGTLPTTGPLFAGWLGAVVAMVGALSFLPALALGPLVEHLLLQGGR